MQVKFLKISNKKDRQLLMTEIRIALSRLLNHNEYSTIEIHKSSVDKTSLRITLK